MDSKMAQPAIDYSKKWYAMSTVAMGIFLATIDGSIVNVAMPTLVRELNTNFATVQWVVLSYLLTVTTLMLGIGRLADMRGKKTIYVTGFVVFTIGSVLCALAPNVYALIGFRVVKAIGAAMIMALGAAIITEAFPTKERGQALGMIGTSVSIGVVIGPTLGGIILDVLNWHWIFLVNLPLGIIGTALAIRFLPAFRPPGGQRFDFAGAIVMFFALASLSLALTLGQGMGFTAPPILALLVVSVVALVIFFYIEKRVEYPMINLGLFRNSTFSTNVGTGFTSFLAISGIFLLMPFYLDDILGLEIRQVGLMLAIFPVALGVVAPLGGSLSDRFGTRPISVIGLMVLLAGYVWMTTLDTSTSTLGYILRALPLGIGMGLFNSPNNSAIMGSVPREQLGVASGLLSITRTMGQVTGISIMGAIWAGRIVVYGGPELAGAATDAPAAVQMEAMQDTFLMSAFLVAGALAFAMWALIRERKPRAAREAAPGSAAD
jgi:EmrB/QacA subfamily drug resistance transporter